MEYVKPEYDHLFKLKFIGDCGCGKSSILLRFCDAIYTEIYISTIGLNFKIRSIDIDCKCIKLQIWDTPRPERFRIHYDSSYRGSHAIIVVFDVTDQASFSNVKQWLQECDRYAHENVLKYIVGTKCELFSETVVDFSTANSFARSYGLKYIECSPKCDINIDDIFSTISSDILEQLEASKEEKKDKLVIVAPKRKRKESGCAGKIQ